MSAISKIIFHGLASGALKLTPQVHNWKSPDSSSVLYPTSQVRKRWHTLQRAEPVLFLGTGMKSALNSGKRETTEYDTEHLHVLRGAYA
jgi:hypothetical protein